MAADAFLHAWAEVTAELTWVVDTALDVDPPGGLSVAWLEVLSWFEVASLDEDVRLAEVLRDKQTKGAPLREVRACLDALGQQATVRLAPLCASLSPAQASLVNESLLTFASHAFEHYRALATVKKQRMFAAAKALAAKHQYSGTAAPSGYVLTCVTCRAPRLGEALTCAFCGGELEAMS
jgi:hypothetical protein